MTYKEFEIILNDNNICTIKKRNIMMTFMPPSIDYITFTFSINNNRYVVRTENESKDIDIICTENGINILISKLLNKIKL